MYEDFEEDIINLKDNIEETLEVYNRIDCLNLPCTECPIGETVCATLELLKNLYNK